jgi:SAM-dependent methyltransferase
MSLFTGTAQFYSKYRPGLPDQVVKILVDASPGKSNSRKLLDLGTGTGQVIEALLPYFSEIIGVDTDKEMLDVARQALVPAHSCNKLELLSIRAEEFVPVSGWHPDLVTICRAFHWMDQPYILNKLATYVDDGVVAIFGDHSFWECDTAWMQAVRRVVQDFLGEKRRAGSGTFNHHNRPYSDLLKESPFCHVEEFNIPVQRIWNADSIIGYLFSTSFASQSLFGERLNEFKDAIKNELTRYSPDNTFVEDNEFSIRLGRKV